MKSALLVGTLVSALTLISAGCGGTAETTEPAARTEHSAAVPGPTAPDPAIDPSPVPSLPATPRGDLDKKDEARPEEKKAEEKKAEARPESPK